MYETSLALLFGLGVGILLFAMVLVVAVYVVTAWLLSKVFEKAGVDAWRAWVPGYNAMILAKLADVNPWVFLGAVVLANLLTTISFLEFIFRLVQLAIIVLIAMRVSMKFGLDQWYGLLAIIFPVWAAVIGFGNNAWNPNVGPPLWANMTFLRDTTVWNGIPVQPVAAQAQQSPQGYPQQQPSQGFPQEPPSGYPQQSPQGIPQQQPPQSLPPQQPMPEAQPPAPPVGSAPSSGVTPPPAQPGEQRGN